jgi:hypothetical protein
VPALAHPEISENRSIDILTKPQGHEPQPNIAPSKDLQQIRKEAQSAILNLWPFKVRLEDYIEEGIDENVIREQFKALGMLPSPAANNDKGFAVQKDAIARTQPVANASRILSKQRLTNSSNHLSYDDDPVERAPPTKDPVQVRSSRGIAPIIQHAKPDNKGEERKDRIARLLAEKNKKQTTTSANIKPTTPETTSNIAIVAIASQKAEKERLLREKMEALQKLRNSRVPKPDVNVTAETDMPGRSKTAASPHDSLPTSVSISLVSQDQPATPQSRSISPQQILNKQLSQPSIPGLFLAGSSSNAQNGPFTNNTGFTTTSGNQRKRPVASDFDSPSTSSSLYKRPFGQNRVDQPLVIDVSEDESDNDDFAEMDLEPQLNHSQIQQNSSSGANFPKSMAIRDLPPLSDVPSRKGYAATSATLGTPPSMQPTNKNGIGGSEDLQRKELEIQVMKQKIANAERRNKAKKTSSGIQTPSQDPLAGTLQPTAITIASSNIESSNQIEHQLKRSCRQVDEDRQKLVETHAAEIKKTHELEIHEAERRRIRHAKIVADLPLVDARVEQDQKRIMDLQAEMARLQAAVDQALQDKRTLAEEMEKLRQEAEIQLQEQKDKLRELHGNINSGEGMYFFSLYSLQFEPLSLKYICPIY